MKGRYRFSNVKDALNRRLNSLTHPDWVKAMTLLVTHYSRNVPFFRWHDSGDLQGAWHLKNIFEVCKATPAVSHWLPTREAKLLSLMDPDVTPQNLIFVCPRIWSTRRQSNSGPGRVLYPARARPARPWIRATAARAAAHAGTRR